MEVRPWKVFLDTSALIAGVVSPSGAAREVLRLAEVGLIAVVMSRQVLSEADRNISTKLPALLPDYRALLARLTPQVVEDPSREAVREAERVIHHKDAPILAAACAADVNYLVTWNTHHFRLEAVRAFARCHIVTPGELLHAFRQSIEGPP